MKYLKPYNESKDITLYVNDILRDLEDAGFSVFVKYSSSGETLPRRPHMTKYTRLDENVEVEICNTGGRMIHSSLG